MSAESPAEPHPQQVKFHQIKSNFFRVVHADGIWGGVHPNELYHLTFFSERAPVATEVVHDLTEDGKLGAEDFSKRESKKGFVREMEVDVVLSRTTAESLRNWLDANLKGTFKAPTQETI